MGRKFNLTIQLNIGESNDSISCEEARELLLEQWEDSVAAEEGDEIRVLKVEEAV